MLKRVEELDSRATGKISTSAAVTRKWLIDGEANKCAKAGCMHDGNIFPNIMEEFQG